MSSIPVDIRTIIPYKYNVGGYLSCRWVFASSLDSRAPVSFGCFLLASPTLALPFRLFPRRHLFCSSYEGIVIHPHGLELTPLDLVVYRCHIALVLFNSILPQFDVV